MSAIKDLSTQFCKDLKEREWTDVLRGAVMWSSTVGLSVYTSTLVLSSYPIVHLIDKNHHFLHNAACNWARMINIVNPWWNFKIIGKENLPEKGKPAVFVANHQSQADILALFLINTRFRWLAKESLFKIPLFGWAMSAVGYVSVKRGDKKSAEECMKKAENHLKNGIPMLFFPEGTRSSTGKLGNFKSGAFRLAKSMNVPVIPITVNGCSELLPKGSLLPRKTDVTIIIHPAIDTSNLKIQEIIDKARSTIKNSLPEELR